jgi:hypothetical protein
MDDVSMAKSAALRNGFVLDQPDRAHAIMIPPIRREVKFPDNGARDQGLAFSRIASGTRVASGAREQPIRSSVLR